MSDSSWTPETIKGWRLFIWDRFGQRVGSQKLTSITVPGHAWHNEMPPATCATEWAPVKTPHQSPDPKCACGYWSLKPALLHHPFEWTKAVWDMQSVILHGTLGWVESWGTVWEYEHGYRAERMKITALINLTEDWTSKHYRWYMSNDQVREKWAAKDLNRHRHRVEQAAATYDLPIVSIDDTQDALTA